MDGAGVAGEEVAEVVHGPDGEFEGLACGDGRLNEVCGVIGPEDAVAGDATDGNGIAGRRDRGTGGAGGGDGAGGGQGRLEDMDAIVGGNKGVVCGKTGGAVAAGEVDGAGVAGEEVAEVVHGPDGEFEGLACGDGRLNEVCGVIGPENAVAGDAADRDGIAGGGDAGGGGVGGGEGLEASGLEGHGEVVVASVAGLPGVVGGEDGGGVGAGEVDGAGGVDVGVVEGIQSDQCEGEGVVGGDGASSSADGIVGALAA